MTHVSEYIQRAAEHTKFKREFFLEKNMPTETSNVLAIPVFGDIRSTCIMSSCVLKRIKDLNPEKYLILASWPGQHGLFPYVDEYWCLEDQMSLEKLASEANNFYNQSKLSSEISISFGEVLRLMSPQTISGLYNNGFTDKYWDTFKTPKIYLPEVPSANKLTESFKAELNRLSGRKIIVHPVRKIWSWHRGKQIYLSVSQDFWKALLNCLIDEGYAPVLYQNVFTYDMSREFTNSCIYLVPRNITDVMAAFHNVGLVLDVFSGVSRLAIASRTPYVAVDERQRFMNTKDYALDDLCMTSPRSYIFSFSTMLLTEGPKEWKRSILDNIVVRLKKFQEQLDWKGTSTNESYEEVSYSKVRNRNAKRMGVTFIGSSKNK